jgi:thiol-disulfide isomerase/thioredoxin
MKHIILHLLLFLLISQNPYAQTCKVSGTVNDPSIKEVYLFLLEGDTYFASPSAKFAVLPNGSFNSKVIVPAPVFAILKAGEKQQRLLLSTGRDVHIAFESGQHSRNTITGTGAIENKLISSSVLDTIPFFKNRKWTASELTPASWQATIMQPVEQDINTTNKRIQQANLPAHIKKLLASELLYAYQCYLNDFTADNLRWSKHPDRNVFLDNVMKWQPLPDSQALPSGFYANMMLDRHSRYASITAIGNNKDRKKVEEALASYLKMPFDSINSLVEKHGQTIVMGWLYARFYMPASIRDKILYNYIKAAANDGSLNTCSYLFNILKENFPQSFYIDKIKATMQEVDNRIAANEKNKHIVFRDAGGIQTFSQLVAPYQGKIVYLDIWGTWCGPCKKEMPYAPELKKRYAGKDIVFVYLDVDDASRETDWKEIVYHAGLEGEHYRMDKQAIERIWQAVQEAGGKTNSYPAFVIIGKDGKIINPDAERPGSREKLYAQLDKVL